MEKLSRAQLRPLRCLAVVAFCWALLLPADVFVTPSPKAKPPSQLTRQAGSEEIAVATDSATSPLLAPLKVASLGMGLLKPIFAAEAKLQALGYDEEEIRAKISEDVKSAPVVVYTYGLSPFCTEATKLLDSLGAQYKEIQLAPEWFLMLGESAAKRAELGAMYGRALAAPGKARVSFSEALLHPPPTLGTSMPHIFIGGESIGGLMEGERFRKLDSVNLRPHILQDLGWFHFTSRVSSQPSCKLLVLFRARRRERS